MLRIAPAAAVFSPQSRTNHDDVVPNLSVTHRTRTKPGAMRRPSLESSLIIGYSEVGQCPVVTEGAVVVEYDVPGERRRSRIRIERRYHLSSERVSVDAVFERDGRQRDLREPQVNAAVAEDDHCEVSRRRDLWLRHHVDVQNPCASNRVRRRIQNLTITGDELAVRKAASVVLRRLERRRAQR
jgi:hypothetical protein